jgi:hypothetical protein
MALAWGTSMDDASSFCVGSRAWVRAVFTEALGEEVEVELVQAIGRGMSVVSSVSTSCGWVSDGR